MSQVLQRKFVPCRKCQQLITFDNAHKSQSGKFIPLRKDSVGQLSAHQCPNRKERQQQSQWSGSSNYAKEIAAIKAQLLELVSSLDRIERQEMTY